MDKSMCTRCSGTGVDSEPKCCGGSQWECGERGCTGPEQQACRDCNGFGFVYDEDPIIERGEVEK